MDPTPVRFDLFRGMKWPAYTKATKSDSFVKAIAAGMCDVKPRVSKMKSAQFTLSMVRRFKTSM